MDVLRGDGPSDSVGDFAPREAAQLRIAFKVLVVYCIVWGSVITLGGPMLRVVYPHFSSRDALEFSALDYGGWAILSLAAYFCSSLTPVEIGPRWKRVLVVLPVTAVLLLVCRIGVMYVLSLCVPFQLPTLDFLISAFPGHFVIVAAFLLGGYALQVLATAWNPRVLRVDLETWLARAHVDTLNAQLHPHFLFNALNSVSALLRHRPLEAEDVLMKVRGLLAVAFERARTQLIPLREEISFVRTYLEVEQVRYRNRLVSQISVAPGTGDVLVPPLTLQPLVENAVRHGIGERPGGGRIEVSIRATSDQRVRIVVQDDGGGIAPGAQSGAGTANTRARLQRVYGLHHEFEIRSAPGEGTTVRIDVPVSPPPPPRSEPRLHYRTWPVLNRSIAPLTGGVFAFAFGAVLAVVRGMLAGTIALAAQAALYTVVELAAWAVAAATVSWVVRKLLSATARWSGGSLPSGTAPPGRATWHVPVAVLVLEITAITGVARAAALVMLPPDEPLRTVCQAVFFHTVQSLLLAGTVGAVVWVARFRPRLRVPTYIAISAADLGFPVLRTRVMAPPGVHPSAVHVVTTWAPGALTILANAFLIGYAIVRIRGERISMFRQRMREARTIRSELRIVQEQLRPELLLDAIDAVREQIHVSRHKADEVLSHVGDILRAAIRRKPSHLISAREEYRAANAILAVAEARHGRTFPAQVSMRDGLHTALLPPLVLAPYLESLVEREIGAKPGVRATAIDIWADSRRRLVIDVRESSPSAEHPLFAALIVRTEGRLRTIFRHRHRVSVRHTPGGTLHARFRIPLLLANATALSAM